MTEPEEIIEAHLVEALEAAETPLKVVGALAAVEEGEEKTAPLSYIGVAVDVSSQDIDWKGPKCPYTYTANIAVRVAFADDKSGALFRDAARDVRAVIAALTGDGCEGLDGDGFACDEFLLEATATSVETMGDGEGMNKTYTATIKGRFNTTTTTNETEATNG